jgi:hypothetical protein
MKSMRAGQLVTVTDEDGTADAIISNTSHLPRVVIVALDADGEPAFRDVHIGRLRPRKEPGPDDAALRALISAASAEARSGAPGSRGSITSGAAAHTGPRMHRPTGR